MTHLTRTTQKSLFETIAAERPRSAPAEAGMVVIASSSADKPFAVATDQTPEQARMTNSANWPGYDWPSVRNLPPRTRGKHY